MRIIPRDHTLLTKKTFYSLGAFFFTVEIFGAGYGFTDAIFASHGGTRIIAGFSVGHSIFSMCYAFLIGIADIFSVQLAKQEGRNSGMRDLGILLRSLFGTIVVFSPVIVGLVFLSPYIFAWMGTDQKIIGIATSYVTLRLWGTPLTLCALAVSLSLRVLNKKKIATLLVLLGFCVNLLADSLFLYSPLAKFFPNAAVSIGAATLVVHFFSAITGGIILKKMHSRSQRRGEYGDAPHIRFFPTVRIFFFGTFGAGVRNMNDYAAAVIPILCISHLGTAASSALSVANNIRILYCRMPQAGFSAASTFLSYAHKRSQSESKEIALKVLRYISIPSSVWAAIVLVALPWLMPLYGGVHTNYQLAAVFIIAYFVAIPAYILENVGGGILLVEQKNRWLSVTSTLVTYLIAIPIAVIGVYVWHLAVIAVLSTGVASLLIAMSFWTKLRTMRYRIRR